MGQIKGQNDKSKMWLTNSTIKDIEEIKAKYPMLYKYEIVELCVNFFKETGHNPMTFKEESVAKVLERFKNEIIISNNDLIEENRLARKNLLKTVKNQEKTFFNPIITKLERATNLFAEHLKQENIFEPKFEPKKDHLKANDWLEKIKNEIVPK